MNAQNKMLVLLDGSDRSRETVKYVANVNAFKDKTIVLYHVYSEIPEYYWDLDQDPQHPPYTFPGFDAWQREKLSTIEAFMEENRAHLLKSGIADDRVVVDVHRRESGIARDILKEAGRGYDAVIMRRRGMSKTTGLVLGSISAKLLSKLSDVPILLAGKRPQTDRILIAVDGSESSFRAVDFVAGQLGPYGYKVELLHVIRGGALNPANPEFIPAEMLELIQEEMSKQIEKMKARLIAAGFTPDHITEKILSGVDSRSEAIVREAEGGDFGTIVLGRKGVSRIEEFFIGSVSEKVIHSGQDFTVWII
jgi:nucleotide-binding universal stress UspA family protein